MKMDLFYGLNNGKRIVHVNVSMHWVHLNPFRLDFCCNRTVDRYFDVFVLSSVPLPLCYHRTRLWREKLLQRFELLVAAAAHAVMVGRSSGSVYASSSTSALTSTIPDALSKIIPVTRIAEYGTSSSFPYADTSSILVAWRQPFGIVNCQAQLRMV